MTAQDERSGNEGISLDELAQAFAQVMGTAPKLRPAAAEGTLGGASATPANTGEASAALALDSQLSALDSADPCPISPFEHPRSDALRRVRRQSTAVRRADRTDDAGR